MLSHVLLPGIDLGATELFPPYRDFLREWRERAIRDADGGDVAASTCLQASIIDLVLDGKPTHDWIGVMEEFLTNEDRPIAYSRAYGKRLYGFDGQYLQSTIHATHTRWWVELLNGKTNRTAVYAKIIVSKKQADSLIYDYDVSPTTLRHRMKSELTMAAAMSAELLAAAGKLTTGLGLELATALTDPRKCPPLGYAVTESLRLAALTTLGHAELFPTGIEKHMSGWTAGLEVGWCDFAVAEKIDAYMGTAKRTQRDKPVHSPLVAWHVRALSAVMEDKARTEFSQRLEQYRKHMIKEPFDIRAFQMRDIPIPFGADITPIELVSASAMVTS